jgi:hypothetical protein
MAPVLRNRMGAPTWPKPAPTRPGVMDRTAVLQRGDGAEDALPGAAVVTGSEVAVSSEAPVGDGDVVAGDAARCGPPLHAALAAASSPKRKDQVRPPTRPPTPTIGHKDRRCAGCEVPPKHKHR